MKATRVLILGHCALVPKLIAELRSAEDAGFVLVGVVDNAPSADDDGAQWLGTLDRFTDIVEEVHPDLVVVAMADRRGHLPLKALLE